MRGEARSGNSGPDWRARLDRYLASQGLKRSGPRLKVAELILAEGGHLDAREIVDRVRRKHPGIGQATVYRTLKTLCDAEMLKESLTDDKGRVVYEHFGEEHHDHIVCLDCGEIFEFHSEAIEKAQSQVLGELGFTQVRHRHVIYANCRNAAKAAKSPRR